MLSWAPVWDHRHRSSHLNRLLAGAEKKNILQNAWIYPNIFLTIMGWYVRRASLTGDALHAMANFSTQNV